MELGIISLASQKPCHLKKVRQAEQRQGKNKDSSTTIQIYRSKFFLHSDLSLPNSTGMHLTQFAQFAYQYHLLSYFTDDHCNLIKWLMESSKTTISSNYVCIVYKKLHLFLTVFDRNVSKMEFYFLSYPNKTAELKSCTWRLQRAYYIVTKRTCDMYASQSIFVSAISKCTKVWWQRKKNLWSALTAPRIAYKVKILH